MKPEDINQAYQDFQDDLATRELHLKLLPAFKDERLDDLLNLLKEVKGDTPTLTDNKQPTPESTNEIES